MIPRYNDLIPLYCIYERDNLLDVIINYLFGILQHSNLIKIKIYSKSFKIYPKLLRIEHIIKNINFFRILDVVQNYFI